MGKLRPADLNGAEAVTHILIQSRKAFLPYTPLAHSEKEVHQWVEERLIPSNGVTIYVYKRKVAGVIAVSNHEGINWIDQLYVTPLMVGQGIGTNLLEYSLKKLSRPIRLYAFQQNMRARKFYERFGFQAIAFSDGQSNEEKCPDVLYELRDFL